MPIGDLLASISGSKPTPNPTTTIARTNSIPSKRKPETDLRGDVSKTPRQAHQNYVGNARPVQVPSSRLSGSTTKLAKSAPAGRSGPLPVSAVPKAPPKKGSFAEILARGQRAQASMGQVGKIQHKKVQKGAIKKPRDETNPPARTPSKGKQLSGYSGTSKPSPRNGISGSKSSGKERRQDSVRPTAGRGKGTPAGEMSAEEAAKKLRKAAQATTGYTGTARPKPGNPARKSNAPRGGALLQAPRHGSSKSSRYEDDYDEELDDFIDYDDEEEDAGGPRYDYASDASSDMEAGLDDIDGEERRAEFIARREDEEEQRIEKSLKTAKEERKRKALEALRAKRH